MADIDISAIQPVGITESKTTELSDIAASVIQAITLAESVDKMLAVLISAIQAVGAADVVSSAPVRYFQLYRAANAASIGFVDRDWKFTDNYVKYMKGILLKGIILIPGSGGPDTFSIKDGSDTGPYLYKGAVSAATVLVYPGTFCKPYIDYSECTLSTGHLFTFLWE